MRLVSQVPDRCPTQKKISLSSFQFLVPMDTLTLPGGVVPSGREPLEYSVRLTRVASINLE